MEAIHAGTGEITGNHSDPNTLTDSDSSEQTGCFRCLRRGIPLNCKKQFSQLSKLAGLMCVAQLLVFLIPFVSTVFCGHLGKTELAGVTLATSIVSITGISIGQGLATTCDTFISQTFGSRNLKRVGVILQRAVLILLLACCPCWALLMNTESILLAFKQSPEVARLSQMYVEIFMPALPATFLFELQVKYLQSQGILWPQILTGIVGNVLNALINYIFLFVLHLGVVGSAAANMISQYCLALFLFAYILCKGLHKPTWGGWSVECLQEWGPFVRFAIPSMIMACADLWMIEIGGFLAGLISEVELGSQSVIRMVSGIPYKIYGGINVAATVTVGNALGAGNVQQAQLSCKISMTCAVVISLCVAVIVGSSSDVIAIVFTNDEQIRRRTGEAIVMYTPFQIFEGILCAVAGIFRGAAKQKIGAVSILVFCYFVCLPIGASLMFVTKLGITGWWIGLFTGYFLLTPFYLAIFVNIDWKKAESEAQVRAGVQPAEKRDRGQPLEMQGGSHEITPDNHEEGHSPWQFNSDLEVLHERDSGTLTTVGEVLTFRQLCLRRGLALCSMLVLLAAGILTNMLLPAVFTSGLNETSTVPPTVDNLWTHNTMDQMGQV
ncbi:multidrug and toxin extrusion protein 1-like [Conger conger]|uniref:multidrug and toxin extrusion protein 1-like n=1 Tax=Conger conger TaxID=82655 RepID=UPI002A5AD857|nr:multidrug and toxin extrusion protein 1-like [Conger conger]